MKLAKVLRSFAIFYGKVGPSASTKDKGKSEILRDLDIAEQPP